MMSTRESRSSNPVHRDLVDAQPGAFGQHEQFGVEEPAGVLGERKQRPRLVAPDGLEAALRVREARAHQSSQQHVVASRDELPLRPADDPRSPGEPGSDGQVAVPGQQRGHQRQQGVQVCRQIDIHVGQDLGVALRPDGPQSPAASRQLHVDGPHLGQLTSQAGGNRPGGIGAAVIGDRDPGVKRKAFTQIADQAPNARCQIAFLIADRHHYVHLQNSHGTQDRRPLSAVPEARLCARYEQSRFRLAATSGWPGPAVNRLALRRPARVSTTRWSGRRSFRAASRHRSAGRCRRDAWPR